MEPKSGVALEVSSENALKAAKRLATKTRNAQVAAENAKKAVFEHQLKELRERSLDAPPASRTYRVGDLVVYGLHPNSQITQVLDNGLIYEVRLWGTYTVAGQPVARDDVVLLPWVDLLPIRAAQVTGSVIEDHNPVRLNYSQRTVSGLLHAAYHSGFKLDPDYQRELCWEPDDKLAYIESIMEGRDIGKFVVVSLGHNNPCYELLDGKQRFSAIKEFYEDRFPYKGRLFSELCTKDRYTFEEQPIAYAIVERATRAQKLAIFLKVNSAGKQQTPEWIAYVQGLLKSALTN